MSEIIDKSDKKEPAKRHSGIKSDTHYSLLFLVYGSSLYDIVTLCQFDASGAHSG